MRNAYGTLFLPCYLISFIFACIVDSTYTLVSPWSVSLTITTTDKNALLLALAADLQNFITLEIVDGTVSHKQWTLCKYSLSTYQKDYNILFRLCI